MVLPHVCTKALPRKGVTQLKQELFKEGVRRSGEDTMREWMSNRDVWRLGENTCLVLPHTCTKAAPCAQTPYLKQALFKGEIQRSGEDTMRELMLNRDVRRSGEDIRLVLPHICTKAPPRAQTPYLKQALVKGKVQGSCHPWRPE